MAIYHSIFGFQVPAIDLRNGDARSQLFRILRTHARDPVVSIELDEELLFVFTASKRWRVIKLSRSKLYLNPLHRLVGHSLDTD